MNGNIHSGDWTPRKGRSVNAEAKAGSGTGCSFCWFVLTVYPGLNGMTEKDTATYRQHLRKAHGLKEDITS
jgi:hypothetical protein